MINNIFYYKNALILANEDDNFRKFLNSLNEEETETYLYIESKRIECYLKELSIFDFEGNPDGHNNNSHIIKSQKDYSFLKDFVRDLNELPKPEIKLRNSLIGKHKEFVRELTDSEIFFFQSC
jgi:hypothetical protein